MKKTLLFALPLVVVAVSLAACKEKTTQEKLQDAAESAKDDANKAMKDLQGK